MGSPCRDNRLTQRPCLPGLWALQCQQRSFGTNKEADDKFAGMAKRHWRNFRSAQLPFPCFVIYFYIVHDLYDIFNVWPCHAESYHEPEVLLRGRARAISSCAPRGQGVTGPFPPPLASNFRA